MLSRILQSPINDLLVADNVLMQQATHYSTDYGAFYTEAPPCATSVHDEKAVLSALLHLEHAQAIDVRRAVQVRRFACAYSHRVHAVPSTNRHLLRQAYITANAMYYAPETSTSFHTSPESSPRLHTFAGHPQMTEPETRRGKCRRGKRGSRGRKRNPNAAQYELPRAPVWAQGTAWNPRVQPVTGSPAGTGVFIPGECHTSADQGEEDFDCDHLRELVGNLPDVWEY